MNFKIAVGYARTSGEINPKTSIPNQINAIEEFSRDHQVFLRKIYVDECKTGTKVEGRDQYAQMTQLLDEEDINMVIVSNFDRFSRNSLDFTRTITTLKRRGIGIYSLAQNSNTMNMSAVEIAMAAIQAEMENNMRIERLSSARNQVRRQGKFNSTNLPFGYTLDDQRYLIINQEETDIVKDVFEIFLREENYAKTFNQIKVIHPDFSMKYESIKSILTRALYIGKDCVLRKKDDGSIYFEMISNRAHPPIISEKTFLKTVECIERITLPRRIRSNKPHVKYLLSGAVVCDRCGKTLRGKKGNYVCACRQGLPAKELHQEWKKYMKQLEKNQLASISQKEKKTLMEKIEKNRIRFATCRISTATYERNEKQLYEEIRRMSEQAEDGSELYAIKYTIKLFKEGKTRELKKMIKELKLYFRLDIENRMLYEKKQNLA